MTTKKKTTVKKKTTAKKKAGSSATVKKKVASKKKAPPGKKAVKKTASRPGPPSPNAFAGASWAAAALMANLPSWRESFGWDETNLKLMADRLNRKQGDDRIRNRETPSDLAKLVRKQVALANKKEDKRLPAWKLYERSLTKSKPLPSMLELAAFVNSCTPVVLLVRIPNDRLAARFEMESKTVLFLPVVARRMESYLVQPAPTLAPLTLTTSELLACWHGGSLRDLGPWPYDGKRWMIALHRGKESPHLAEEENLEPDIDDLLDSEVGEEPEVE